ncbi:hypothetical protein AUC61_25275 [Pseudomonas sp. S25]|uniref:Uncharacterized protein n=1 Tax=Pseudomonas maioricensis TaxID=1766623 RepID=A0ABS9ZQK2_9PSED|nr:hypothetical protein [Pseudomonas sp. S25]
MTAGQLAGRRQKRHRNFLAQVSADELFDQCQSAGRQAAGYRHIKTDVRPGEGHRISIVINVVRWVVHGAEPCKNSLRYLRRRRHSNNPRKGSATVIKVRNQDKAALGVVKNLNANGRSELVREAAGLNHRIELSRQQGAGSPCIRGDA